MEEPDKKWLEKTIMINREEIAEIVTEQVAEATALAYMMGEPEFAEQLKEMLLQFSAKLCTKIFKKADVNSLEVEE